MPRFVIHISEQKRNLHLIRACLHIAVSFFCLGVLIYSLFFKEELTGIRAAFSMVFVLQSGWSGYDYLQKRKRKEFFLEVDEFYLKWIMTERGNPTITNWNDIHWIKKEKSGDILIFRDSSFSVGISLKSFQPEQQEQIICLLEQYANQKKIRLINFSEPSLAIA